MIAHICLKEKQPGGCASPAISILKTIKPPPHQPLQSVLSNKLQRILPSLRRDRNCPVRFACDMGLSLHVSVMTGQTKMGAIIPTNVGLG